MQDKAVEDSAADVSAVTTTNSDVIEDVADDEDALMSSESSSEELDIVVLTFKGARCVKCFILFMHRIFLVLLLWFF